jgi:hypothetical protein
LKQVGLPLWERQIRSARYWLHTDPGELDRGKVHYRIYGFASLHLRGMEQNLSEDVVVQPCTHHSLREVSVAS